MKPPPHASGCYRLMRAMIFTHKQTHRLAIPNKRYGSPLRTTTRSAEITMETRIPESVEAAEAPTAGLSTSADTIRSLNPGLPQRSPLPVHPSPRLPSPSPGPSSPSASPASSLLSLDYDYDDSNLDLDSVSSSFFFSSAAASPGPGPMYPHHHHHHPQPAQAHALAGELVIPSLTLPAPLLEKPQLRGRRNTNKSGSAVVARFLVVGSGSGDGPLSGGTVSQEDSDQGWRVASEEIEHGCRRCVLRRDGSDGDDSEEIELVLVGSQLTNDSDLTPHILHPFRLLARVLHSPPSTLDLDSEQAEEDRELVLALLASDASPLYTALLVVPPATPELSDIDAAVPQSVRRLVPVAILDIPKPPQAPAPAPAEPQPIVSSLSSPGLTPGAAEVSADAEAEVAPSPAEPSSLSSSLFVFDNDDCSSLGGLVSPPAPAPTEAAESGSSASSAADLPAAITAQTITESEKQVQAADKEDVGLDLVLPSRAKIAALRRDAAGLFLDWWALARRPSSRYHHYTPTHHLHHQLPQMPSSSAAPSLSARSKPRSQARPTRKTLVRSRPSVSVVDPLHLPSLLRLVRDVVVASVAGIPMPGSAVLGALVGLGVGVVVGAWATRNGVSA
ncbi:hypothetical protein HMN09_00814200 [Mycena chlorophos]|uniref:Uncharacterized protein n=1 Tax=Mycena chlorophos TaxID=658473 RepID=A0A8H6SV09_MYCCL|nr:hypothetical protein HMN09_00814200 [Mycena chlorophos]